MAVVWSSTRGRGRDDGICIPMVNIDKPVKPVGTRPSNLPENLLWCEMACRMAACKLNRPQFPFSLSAFHKFNFTFPSLLRGLIRPGFAHYICLAVSGRIRSSMPGSDRCSGSGLCSPEPSPALDDIGRGYHSTKCRGGKAGLSSARLRGG